MKLCKELDNKYGYAAIYIDAKCIDSISNANKNVDFRTFFEKYLYKQLFDRFIANDVGKIKEWKKYRIENEVAFNGLKEKIILLNKQPLAGDDWLILEKEAFREEFLNLLSAQNVSSLVNFLKRHYRLILCFDNIDRFHYDDEGEILDFSIHLSNECQIPIILSIRTLNLHRTIESGANSDIVFTDEIKCMDLETLISRPCKKNWVSMKKILALRLKIYFIRN